MDHPRHLGRCIAIGVGALVLSGAGAAGATTPTEPSDDTTMATTDTALGTSDTAMGATSEPMTGGGPSDCPPIPEAPATTEAPAAAEAPATSAAATGTEMTDTSAATGTEMTDTSAPSAGADATMATEATTGSVASAATESVPAVSGPFVQVAESDEYGPVLVDSECRTLYGFAQDVDGEPTCVDDCAVNWPPLFTPDESVPAVADELDPSLFSVVEHPEGSMLKAGDWPLYYFANDAAPGDTNGQGIGGVWWMVASDGTLLEEAAGTEGSAPGTDAAASDASAPAASMPTDTASLTTTG